MTKQQSRSNSDPYGEKLQLLKDGLERANNLRIQAETRLEELYRQEKEIIEQIRALGVEPDQLEEELARLEEEITTLIEEIESIIPWDLLGEGPAVKGR